MQNILIMKDALGDEWEVIRFFRLCDMKATDSSYSLVTISIIFFRSQG